MALVSWQAIERNYICDATFGTPVLTASGGSDLRYPVENLRSYARWQTWQSGVSGAQTLTADLLVAPVTVSAVAIANHNFLAAIWDVKLQKSTNGSSWTDVVTMPFQNFDTSSLADTEDYFIAFTPTSARYWRLNWASCTSPPKIGVWALGVIKAWQEADNGGLGYKLDYQLRERRGDSGARFVEQVGRRLLEVHIQRTAIRRNTADSNWNAWSDFFPVVQNLANTLDQHQGGLRPLFFVPHPDPFNDGLKGRCKYMRLANPIESRETHYNIFNDDLVLVEEQ